MVSLSGLSAAYPGYQHAQGVDFQNRQRQLQNTDLETEQAGQAAFGNTLKMFQQQVPGAQPIGQPQQMAGGMPQPPMPQGPQAPMPGQPSVPNDPNPRSSPMGTAQYHAGSMGAPPMRPPQPMQAQMPSGGGQPMGGPPMQQPGMPGPQGQGMQGQLDWKVIMGKVAQANPGAPPQVLAAAVTKFLPLMNQQAQMEWKQVQMMLMAQRADQGERRLDISQGESERKGEQGDKRIAQGDQRIGIAKGAEERRTDQGNKRIEQGDTRIGQRNRQLDREDDRETRLAASAQVRADQGIQRLELQKQNLERQITQGGNRQALGEWRAVLDAQHKRATEIINSANANVSMKPEERKALLKEQDAFYRGEIEKMRSGAGRSTPDANVPSPGGKTSGRVPAGTSNPAASLPAEAVGQLKEGHVTTFNNGQKWMLKNGQPEQVP